MISRTFKSVSMMVFAVGFSIAVLASCGAKKEEVIEEERIEEVTPPVIEEIPADTTMTDTTSVDTTASN
jgi:hypothetical protein